MSLIRGKDCLSSIAEQSSAEYIFDECSAKYTLYFSSGVLNHLMYFYSWFHPLSQVFSVFDTNIFGVGIIFSYLTQFSHYPPKGYKTSTGSCDWRDTDFSMYSCTYTLIFNRCDSPTHLFYLKECPGSQKRLN